MRNMLNYTALSRLHTFEERFDYLKLKGVVGESTFGFDRFMNQQFYASREWKDARREAIARDLGCDLGVEGFEIHDRVYVHHMRPLTPKQVQDGNIDMFDPEYLITVSFRTHQAIHFGDERMLPKPFVPRRPGDTQLWQRR